MSKRSLPSSTEQGAGGTKKPRVKEPVDPSVPTEMCHCYQNGEFQERLRKFWENKQAFHDEPTNTTLLDKPFQCCVLPNFIEDSGGFLNGLKNELLRLKFHEKNNDLYQFHQFFQLENTTIPSMSANYHKIVNSVAVLMSASHLLDSRKESNSTKLTVLSVIIDEVILDICHWLNSTIDTSLSCGSREETIADICQWSDDLKKFKTPHISALKTMFQSKCLPWLRTVTGINLSHTMDMTCSKYEYTDTLLCHDDELEGRRIAFIFYLVPEWTKEDGGTLDLFNTDEHGRPKDVAKSLVPNWNSFVFFEVNAVSFHQVSEVLSPSKTRLSVNGWFHGPPVDRPCPYIEPAPMLFNPIPAELKVLSDWVSPLYLDVGVQSSIQQQFEAESQIELPEFFLEEKYKLLCQELESVSLPWTVKGPPNRRHVHIAEGSSIPVMVSSCLEFLRSEPFCRLLAHLTGLDLAEDIIRPSLEQLDGPDSETSAASDETSAAESTNTVAVAASCSSSKDGESNSNIPRAIVNVCSRDEDRNNCHKAVPHSEHSNNTTPISLPSLEDTNAPSSSHSEDENASSALIGHSRPVANCRGDLYYWQHGDYTLASDFDIETGEYALETALYFCCEGWSPDYGGVTSYIAKDDDEELLSILPTPNALSLVYRDQDSLRFTKYINHRATEHRLGSFFALAMTYKESGEESVVPETTS